MASTNVDNSGMQQIPVPTWQRGINTALPPMEIGNDELQDLLNFEFDDAGNLSTRRGVRAFSNQTFPTRISSAHHFLVDEIDYGIIFTTGASVYFIPTTGGDATLLAGAGWDFPLDTFWQWRTFNGAAYGVNKGVGGDNPIKVIPTPTGGAPVAVTQVGGSPPKGKYIEIWNNRVWIVSAIEPSTLYGSTLGNAEDWTNTTAGIAAVQIEIDPNDGDVITGLYAVRDTLYIFKRYRIYTLTANALPNTDPANFAVNIFTTQIGCVSPYSIYEVVNDVLFLSDQGVASLALVMNAENFRTAFYSRNVKEITNFPKIDEEIPCYLFDTGAQYWLSIPPSMSPTHAPVVYILDYLKVDQQIVRWARFDGLVCGTAFTSFNGPNGKVFIIGAQAAGGGYRLYSYMPRHTDYPFTDDSMPYSKSMILKSFNAGVQLLLKYWWQWSLGINLMSHSAQLHVGYYFNQNVSRSDSYNFNLMGILTGILWVEGLWVDGLWAGTFSGEYNILREFKSNNFGREAMDLTFTLSNAQPDEGFTVQDFMIWFAPVNELRISNV